MIAKLEIDKLHYTRRDKIEEAIKLIAEIAPEVYSKCSVQTAIKITRAYGLIDLLIND